MSAGLRVRLLGGFAVSIDGVPVNLDAWRLRKSRALVKLLALASEHRLHRDQLVEALWPNLTATAAGNNLHYALHIARRVLAPSTLRLEGGLASLWHPGGVEVDAELFEAAVRRVLAPSHTQEDPAALEAAVALYDGDLLPEDRYEEWAEAPRERLRELAITLLFRLAACYERAGSPTLAADRLQRILITDPAHEAAGAALIRLYAATGHVEDARRQYRQLATLMQREYQADPDPALRRLVESLGRQEQAAAAPEHNLPSPLTRFIGRERELDRIEHALTRGRLVTLSGLGGSGKTRLAIQSATRLLERFPGGVRLVELAAVTDPAHVESAVAAALGVTHGAGRSVREAMRRHLSGPAAFLLLLDNCEHVLASCVDLAADLLTRCPSLHLLATSRRPLGVMGETVLRIAPLTLPDAVQIPNGPSSRPRAREEWTPQALHALRGSEAVRLFEDRARLNEPSFGLTRQTAPAVVQIVRHLDGLPLAVELAAARVDALPVEEIAARLHETSELVDRRFALLTTGNAGAPPRHRSLGALISWTYQALLEPERRLFRRLSVFAGGWSLEASSAICVEEEDVALPLVGLVEHSLVNLTSVNTPSGAPGEARYTMLETLRAYAATRLESEETPAERERLRRRHASYFGQHIAALKSRTVPGESDRLFAAIQRELDNCRAALRWAIHRGEAEIGLRLAVQLSHYWHARGSPAEGLGWVEPLLMLVPEAPDDAQQITAADVYASALESAASLARIVGEFDKARGYQERYLALRRAQGNRRAVVGASIWLGVIADAQGDRAVAHAAMDECLAIARELGDERIAAAARPYLARLAHTDGRLEEARLHLEAWLALLHEAQREERAGALIHLGNVRFCLGDRAGARRVLEEALEIGRSASSARPTADALLYLGWLDYAEGDRTGGVSRLREALALLRDLGLRPQILRCIEQLGVIAFDSGDGERAARLLGAAEALRAELPVNVLPQALARAVGETRRPPMPEELARGGWEDAWRAGRSLTLDEVTEIALFA